MPLRQRQAAQTRRLLLDAAARVFAHHGYNDATIDAVAAEAGASKGAVYHHFTSKTELFRALLADRAVAMEPLTELAATSTTLREMVDGLVEAWFGRMLDDPRLVVLSLESRLQALRDPSARDVLENYYRELRRVLGEALQLAADRFGSGSLRRHTATMMFSVLDGLGQQWAIEANIDLEELREIVEQVVTDLIGNHSPSATRSRARR